MKVANLQELQRSLPNVGSSSPTTPTPTGTWSRSTKRSASRSWNSRTWSGGDRLTSHENLSDCPQHLTTEALGSGRSRRLCERSPPQFGLSSHTRDARPCVQAGTTPVRGCCPVTDQIAVPTRLCGDACLRGVPGLRRSVSLDGALAAVRAGVGPAPLWCPPGWTTTRTAAAESTDGGQPVEVDRIGMVSLGNHQLQLGSPLVRQRVTIRLESSSLTSSLATKRFGARSRSP